ncbi:MAG TPA: hypothetical protein VF329_00575 [Gammaproteobacteria bacterium]
MPKIFPSRGEGRRRNGALGVLIAPALLVATAAEAQEVLDAARECAAITDEAARLDCYDRALGRARGAEPGEPQASEPTPARSGVERDRQRSAEPSRPPAERGVRDAAERGVREPAERSVPDTAEERAQAASAASAAANDEEAGVVPVTIVEVRPRRDGAVFTTDDGEFWVQIDGRRFSTPDTPFAAQIRPGALGSHFLVPDDGGRAIRVRRVD